MTTTTMDTPPSNDLSSPSSVCSCQHPKNLAEFFREKRAFELHTGNINEWLDLRFKGFTNSAEELHECIKLQLEQWNPLVDNVKMNKRCTSADNAISLCQRDQTCSPSVEVENRNDLKITLKIFLGDIRNAVQDMQNCMHSVFASLKTDRVEQLIVSFPDFDLDLARDASDTALAQAWLDVVKPAWQYLEGLVADEQRALKLGVADLDLYELRALHQWADRVKPDIDHYNIDGCCTVPAELQEYARENDISLLTHNDPKEFPRADILSQICTRDLGIENAVCARWHTAWAARYTVMIRTRSVITKKGYVVRFECD